MLLVFLLAATVHTGIAQTQLSPTRIDSRNGISHNTVHAIAQDSSGFMWIGTSDGLNRYDGYTFTTYRHMPGDSASIAANTVQALMVDRLGRLWIGTAAGLDRLDLPDKSFKHVMLTKDDPSPSVGRILLDKTGHIWVATYNRSRLYRLDPESGSSTVFFQIDPVIQSGIDGLHPSVRTCIPIADPMGEIWIGCESDAGATLHRFDPDTERFTKIRIPPGGDPTNGLLFARSGKIWIGPESGSRLNSPVNERFRSLPFDLSDIGGTRRALEDKGGTLWFGTEQGMIRMDPATLDVERFSLDGSGTSTLSNYVWDLFEDRTGIIWIGTRSGLFRVDPLEKPFEHLVPDPARSEPFPVMSIHEDADGGMWTGTLGGGLIFNSQGETRLYRHQSGEPYTLCSDQVWAIHEVGTNPGEIWTGTEDGLCRLDTAAGRFTTVDLPNYHAFAPSVVFDITDDRRGNLWIAGAWEVYRLDPVRRRLLDHYPLHDVRGTVQALHVDPDDVLWIGTEGSGLVRVDAALDSTHYYPFGQKEPGGFPGTTVWTIHGDDQGLLWLGSDMGLVGFDPRSGRFNPFYDSLEMSSSIVYSILEDEQERLWLGTGQGIVLFDKSTGQFRHFGSEVGLENVEFNRRAAARLSNGSMLLGGLRGITAFSPGRIRNNPNAPPVIITGLSKYNRDGVATLNIEGRDRLELDYTDYSFSFDFTALNFTHTLSNRYSYQLEGFDPDWVWSGAERSARYTNIPPGDYVFRVRGSNNDGVWNEAGASIEVSIAPPYWQTGWFRWTGLLLLIALLSGAYRFRVGHLLAMERMRIRIATDLHDDLGGNLSSIALLSDLVRKENRLGEREQHRLAKISESAREMVEAMRDLVWVINPEKDSIVDLQDEIRDTAASLLTGVNVTWSLSGGDLSNTLGMEVRRNVLLLVKEALHNIALHAHAGEVRIHIESNRDHLFLEIADDGIGFDPSHIRNGNGLENIQRRSDRLGAQYDLESCPGKGTVIHVVVPLTRRRRKMT